MTSGLPLWLVGAVLLIAMLAASETGFMVHTHLRRRADAKRSGSSDEGFILSGVLGLLALLMAFAFRWRSTGTSNAVRSW